jgi:hypothetical protein
MADGEYPSAIFVYRIQYNIRNYGVVRMESMSDVILEQVVALALQLSPVDKVRLVERVVSTLKNEVGVSEGHALQTYEGALAHLGTGPSDEDIEEIRREMRKDFPREDI